MKLDRDLNASLNLKQIYTASSVGIQACGDGSSSANESSLLSPSVKQEFNKKTESLYLKSMTLDFCKFKRTVSPGREIRHGSHGIETTVDV